MRVSCLCENPIGLFVTIQTTLTKMEALGKRPLQRRTEILNQNALIRFLSTVIVNAFSNCSCIAVAYTC